MNDIIFIAILLNQEVVKCLPFITDLTDRVERTIRNIKLYKGRNSLIHFFTFFVSHLAVLRDPLGSV